MRNISTDIRRASDRASRLRALLRGESGASLVEYAIVFILMMTMLLGIADFSRALYAFHFVSNAAREGTRFASVRGANCINTTPIVSACPAGVSDVSNFLQDVPLGIDKNNVIVSSAVTTTCNWPAKNAVGDNACITVTYTFNFLFPFVSKKTLTLTSTSTSVIWN